MSEASTVKFNTLMAEGVQFNNAGEHANALAARLRAYQMVPPNSVESGRAARDVGHSYDRLNEPDLAAGYAEQALRTHNIARTANLPGAEREWRASAGYVGTMALGRAINAERIGQSNTKAVQEALWALQEASRGPSNDQYTINFMGRFATASALFGRRWDGIRLGARAVRLGLRSESPKLPTATPNLPAPDRLKAKVKAVGRGVIAGTVAVVNPKQKVTLAHLHPLRAHRRNVALKLAAHVK